VAEDLIAAVAKTDESTRAALERDVTAQWQAFAADGGMALEVGMTTATAAK